MTVNLGKHTIKSPILFKKEGRGNATLYFTIEVPAKFAFRDFAL